MSKCVITCTLEGDNPDKNRKLQKNAVNLIKCFAKLTGIKLAKDSVTYKQIKWMDKNYGCLEQAEHGIILDCESTYTRYMHNVYRGEDYTKTITFTCHKAAVSYTDYNGKKCWLIKLEEE